MRARYARNVLVRVCRANDTYPSISSLRVLSQLMKDCRLSLGFPGATVVQAIDCSVSVALFVSFVFGTSHLQRCVAGVYV